MHINFKVSTEAKGKLEKEFTKALAAEVNKRLVLATNKIRPNIQTLIFSALITSPEVQAMNNSDLEAEFGVPDLMGRINSIIGKLAASIRVVSYPAKLSGNGINARIEIKGVRNDFADILSDPDATYITDSGQVLQWLEWLIIRGDDIIIRGFRIDVDLHNRSRTGGGLIMVPDANASWSVPPQFAGTIDNNFITRALDRAANNIDKLLSGAL